MKQLIIDKEHPNGILVEVEEQNGALPQISYDELVEQLIHERYTIGQEIARLRQKDTKPDEFAEYNAYAEECKLKAKKLLEV